MAEQNIWARALHIPKAQIDEWKAIAPTNLSFTYWCLQTGRIPLKNYFEWARTHYEMPELNSAYFDQNSNRELWNQIKTVANWSPWMLPLEHWDGAIFIGCVEPPADVQWSFPVVYVLAHPLDLEKAWQRLHESDDHNTIGELSVIRPGDLTTVRSQTVLHEAPEELRIERDLEDETPQPEPMIELNDEVDEEAFAIEPELAEPIELHPPIPSQAPAADGPMGLSLNIAKLNLVKPSAHENDSPAHDSATPPDLPDFFRNVASMLQPEEPKAPKTKIKDFSFEAPAGMKAGQTGRAPGKGAAKPVGMPEAPAGMKNSQPPANIREMPSTAVPPPVPSTQESVSKPFVIKRDETNLTKSFVLKPSPPPPRVVTASGPIDISTAPEAIDKAKNQNQALAWYFRQIKSHFQTGMILLYEKDGLVAWSWESGLKPLGESTAVVTFETPSLFRVAARTLRPYHGFVVENAIHTQFFQSWGFAKPPAHVTAIPIVISGAFKGLFLSMTNNSEVAEDALEFSERTADRTVIQLEKTENPFGTSEAA